MIILQPEKRTYKVKLDVSVQTEVTGEEVTRRAKSPLPWHQEVGREVKLTSSTSQPSLQHLSRHDSHMSIESDTSGLDVRPLRKRRRKKISKKKEALALLKVSCNCHLLEMKSHWLTI